MRAVWWMVGLTALAMAAACNSGDDDHNDSGALGGSAGADAGTGGIATGGTTNPPVSCDPGRSRRCYGPDDCVGNQICNGDGDEWSSCTCSSGTGGIGSGGSSGAAGSSAGSPSTAGSAGTAGSPAAGSPSVAGASGAAGFAGSAGAAGSNGTAGATYMYGGGGAAGLGIAGSSGNAGSAGAG